MTGAGRGHAAGTGIGRGRAVAVRGRTGGETDVLVVGGGVIGLSCALACRWRGLGVTLLEKGVTGGQASGAAAGLLAPFSENGEQPDAFFQLCRKSFAMFGDWLDRLREWTDRDVELVRCGTVHVAFHEADEWPMTVRARWQREHGVRAEWVGAARLRELEPSLCPDAVGALFYPDEAHLRAPVYAEALREACERAGVVIVERANGLQIRLTGDAVVLESGAGESGPTGEGGATGKFGGGDAGSGAGNRKEGPVAGRWEAGRLILCTGAWSAGWQEALGIRIPVHPIRGQICSFPVPFGRVRRIVFSPQGYAVGKKNGTLVCGASEDVAGFDASVTEEGIGRLVRMGRRLFPELADVAPCHAWAGLRPATRDGWPLIGPVNERVFCAFGHYRNGVLLSPVTAAWAAAWAAGGEWKAEKTGSGRRAETVGGGRRAAREGDAKRTDRDTDVWAPGVPAFRAAFDPRRFTPAATAAT